MIISNSGGKFGILDNDFEIEFSDSEYNVVVGPGNLGKSSILQLMFRQLYKTDGVGGQKICLITPDRLYVSKSGQPGTQDLKQYNNNLFISYGDEKPIDYDTPRGPDKNTLTTILVNHDNYVEQLTELNEYLSILGYEIIRSRALQNLEVGIVNVSYQGSGFRSVIAILAALTNPDVQYLMIDEPELHLEPVMQKKLYQILIENKKSKTIVVCTHSQHFLNKKKIQNNQRVELSESKPKATKFITDLDLSDAVFRLLGASPNDIFFPRNYIICEGSSDQLILAKVMELMKIPANNIKPYSSRGISNVPNNLQGIVACLTPYLAGDGYYKGKVCVILDKPNNVSDEKVVEQINSQLGADRVSILSKASLEEYLDESLYLRADLKKNDVLTNISSASSDDKKNEIKRDVSTKISSIMKETDLEMLPEFVTIINKALDLS